MHCKGAIADITADGVKLLSVETRDYRFTGMNVVLNFRAKTLRHIEVTQSLKAKAIESEAAGVNGALPLSGVTDQ